ncbi:substrate-binding periplasmic protein [Roseateles sp. DB2]|uniref:substrate-binding periplasmic protein n=1 Tax=Roseateles sp. DB2 TaxID=3453717 RepID=UPI003EEA2223
MRTCFHALHSVLLLALLAMASGWPAAGFAQAAPPSAPAPQPTARTTGSEPVLTLATGTDDRSSDGRLLRRVFTEALRRLGWRLEVLEMPARRAELALQRGEVDGEMVRTATYGELHPELQRVDAPMMHASFGVYGTGTTDLPQSLDELRRAEGVVIYRRGVAVCEQRLREALPPERLVEISAADNAVRMLARGRARFVCDMDSTFSLSLAHLGESQAPSLHRLFELGSPMPLYPYLHARHAALAPRLVATLQAMRAEGWLTTTPNKGQASR